MGVEQFIGCARAGVRAVYNYYAHWTFSHSRRNEMREALLQPRSSRATCRPCQLNLAPSIASPGRSSSGKASPCRRRRDVFLSSTAWAHSCSNRKHNPPPSCCYLCYLAQAPHYTPGRFFSSLACSTGRCLPN